MQKSFLPLSDVSLTVRINHSDEILHAVLFSSVATPPAVPASTSVAVIEETKCQRDQLFSFAFILLNYWKLLKSLTSLSYFLPLQRPLPSIWMWHKVMMGQVEKTHLSKTAAPDHTNPWVLKSCNHSCLLSCRESSTWVCWLFGKLPA